MAFSVTWVSRLFQVHRRNKSVFPSLGKNIMYFQEIRIPPINYHHVSLGKGVSDGAWVLWWHQGLSSRFCFKKASAGFAMAQKAAKQFLFLCLFSFERLAWRFIGVPTADSLCLGFLAEKKSRIFQACQYVLGCRDISHTRDGYSFSHFINSCSLRMHTGAASPVFNWCCLWCLYSYEFLWCTLTLSILLRSSPARSLSDFLSL